MMLKYAAMTAVVISALAVSHAARSADFAGSGFGAIPDNSSVGRTVSFNVSGITPSVGNVRLRIGLTHSWAGDIVATLRSPGGVSTLIVFGNIGIGLDQPSPTFGANADFAGVYQFADDATLDLWSTALAFSSGVVPAAAYRTNGRGIANTKHGGCSTSLAGAFNNLTSAQANGTWTLTVADTSSGFTGTLDSALLSIGTDAGIFSSGFDPAVRGSCQKARMDYTGSGRTSFVTVRNSVGGATGAVTWTIKNNDGTTSGTQQSFVLGDASNSFTDLDYDGDGVADAAAWKPGTIGQFTIRRSSRPSDAPVLINFGTTGDDVAHGGDYNGDGRDDLALYRKGVTPGAVSRTVIQITGGGARDLVTGEIHAFPLGGDDYTGDGRADMAVQSTAAPGVAGFRIYDGTTGAVASMFNFGAPDESVVLGNYIGTTLADVTTVKAAAAAWNWTTRDSQNGIGQPTVVFGVSGTDKVLTGDYDGDGLDDYAVWRPSATPGLSKFVVRRSSNPATPMEVPSADGDYPVAMNRTH